MHIRIANALECVVPRAAHSTPAITNSIVVRCHLQNRLEWGPWMVHRALNTGNRVLTACDYVGEKISALLGITTPKYDYEIKQFKKMQDERSKQLEEEKVVGGWMQTTNEKNNSASNQSAISDEKCITAQDQLQRYWMNERWKYISCLIRRMRFKIRSQNERDTKNDQICSFSTHKEWVSFSTRDHKWSYSVPVCHHLLCTHTGDIHSKLNLFIFLQNIRKQRNCDEIWPRWLLDKLKLIFLRYDKYETDCAIM